MNANNQRLYSHNINSCELFLGLPWVQRCNPTIKWRHNIWQHKTKPRVKEISLSAFLDVARSRKLAFVAFVRTAHVTLQPSPQILAVKVHKIPNTYQEFKEVFSNTFSQAVPKHSPWDHIINTQNARVPYGLIYSLLERQLQVLWKYLKENFERGWIRLSKSPASAPVLFVPKKNGGLCLCANYRALNAITVKNRYPLTLVSKLLD